MNNAFDYDKAMADIDQRIAVLRRYRHMLESQRKDLVSYLNVIDVRDHAVRDGDMEVLEACTVQEQNLVDSLLTLQQCVEPLRLLFQRVQPEGAPEIIELETRLTRLRDEILRRNDESTALLKAHAADLKLEISKLRATSVPENTWAASASIINIQA